VPPYKETQAYVPRVMQYYEARIAARQHGAARPTHATQAATVVSAEIAPALTRSPLGRGSAIAAQWVPEGPGEGIAQQLARPDAEVSSGLQRAAHSTLRQPQGFQQVPTSARAITARPAQIAPEAAIPHADSSDAARQPVLSVGQAPRLSPATLKKPAGVPGTTEGAERLVQGSAKPAASEGASEEHEPAASVANLSSMISSKMSVAIKDRLTELTATIARQPGSEGATSIARQHLTIELSPPELGRVHISFGLEQGAASVEVRTENFNTAVHLDNSFKSLETSLEQLGLKLASLKVTCDAGGSFGPNYEGTAQPPPWQQQASAGWGALEPGNETQVTATAGDRRGHYSGVTGRPRVGRLVSVLDVAG